MSYAKLFSSITESSLWSEPKEVRLLFVSMLARADSTGFIEASVPGLARMSNLSQEEIESAIVVLESPDPHSKSPEYDGRRILKVPGGWMLLNYEDYRNRRSDDERREYMRKYMKGYRKQRKHSLTDVSNCKPRLAQAEAEAAPETAPDNAGAIDAQCKDRGMQGGKNFVAPKGFRTTMTSVLGVLQTDDLEQLGFLARLSFAYASGFAFPRPLWDYVGRAKRKANPAGYLTNAIRNDCGPDLWQDFLDATPTPTHCQALLAGAES